VLTVYSEPSKFVNVNIIHQLFQSFKRFKIKQKIIKKKLSNQLIGRVISYIKGNKSIFEGIQTFSRNTFSRKTLAGKILARIDIFPNEHLPECTLLEWTFAQIFTCSNRHLLARGNTCSNRTSFCSSSIVFNFSQKNRCN